MRYPASPFDDGYRSFDCPCQWDTPCHYCQTGQCERCVHTDWPGAVSPEGWILDRHGRVWFPATEVWQVGYACRWECPCRTAGHSRQAQQVMW
jgi:hypothetical protein